MLRAQHEAPKQIQEFVDAIWELENLTKFKRPPEVYIKPYSKRVMATYYHWYNAIEVNMGFAFLDAPLDFNPWKDIFTGSTSSTEHVLAHEVAHGATHWLYPLAGAHSPTFKRILAKLEHNYCNDGKHERQGMSGCTGRRPIPVMRLEACPKLTVYKP